METPRRWRHALAVLVVGWKQIGKGGRRRSSTSATAPHHALTGRNAPCLLRSSLAYLIAARFNRVRYCVVHISLIDRSAIGGELVLLPSSAIAVATPPDLSTTAFSISSIRMLVSLSPFLSRCSPVLLHARDTRRRHSLGPACKLTMVIDAFASGSGNKVETPAAAESNRRSCGRDWPEAAIFVSVCSPK